MIDINENINKDDLLIAIKKQTEADQILIYNELKKILQLSRFNLLIDSLKTDELTLDDITEEVEAVRKSRFESGIQVD